MATITPTTATKLEWARMAQDAYRTGRNFYGHRYSARASDPAGTALPVDVYDTLQITYRRWLVFGWEEVEHPA